MPEKVFSRNFPPRRMLSRVSCSLGGKVSIEYTISSIFPYNR